MMEMEAGDDHDDNLPVLPDEIIRHEILTRLPAQSLVHFRSVCKSWSSLIPRNSSSLLLDIWDTRTNQQHLISVEINHPAKTDTPTPPATATRLLTLSSPPLRKCVYHVYHVQSTNGLICLHFHYTWNRYSPINNTEIEDPHDQYPIRVFNPCTREITTLPPASLKNTQQRVPYRRAHVAYNFGFSPLTKEYKVLQVQTFSDEYSPKVIFKIFTLGSSSWRRIEIDVDDLPFDPLWCCWFCCTGGTGVCVHGAIYWLHEKQYIIVVFDVGEERFRVISLPEDTFKNDDIVHFSNGRKKRVAIVKCGDGNLNLSWLKIVEVNGCVALIHVRAFGEDLMQFWILKDYQNQKQVEWVKETVVIGSSSRWRLSSWRSSHGLHAVHTGKLLLESSMVGSSAHVWLLLFIIKSKSFRAHKVLLPKWIDICDAHLNLVTGYDKIIPV